MQGSQSQRVISKGQEWAMLLEKEVAFILNFHMKPSSVAILELLSLLRILALLQVQDS